jgi:hypothetical protein
MARSGAWTTPEVGALSARSEPTTEASARGDASPRAITWLLCALAAATVLGPTASSLVLAVLIAAVVVQVIRREILVSDFRLDALVYVAVFSWNAFTRALATSVPEVAKVRLAWYRMPYLVVGGIKIDRPSLLRVLHVLFGANALIVVLALGQRFLGLPVVGEPLFDASSPARVQGLTGHPNSYAGCIAIVLLLNIGIALYHDRRYFAYTPFLGAGLLFSGSRGYVLGVAVGLVVMLAMSPSLRRSPRYLGIALLVVVVAVMATPGLSQRLADGVVPDRNAYRASFWEISWDIFRDHPVVGIGSGMLPDRLEPYQASGVIDNSAQAHSLYLQELAEDGLPGLVLVTGAYVYFLVKYFRLHRRARDSVMAGVSLAAAAAVLTLLIEGFFDFNFGNAIVAIVLNLVLGLVDGHRHAVEPPVP